MFFSDQAPTDDAGRHNQRLESEPPGGLLRGTARFATGILDVQPPVILG